MTETFCRKALRSKGISASAVARQLGINESNFLRFTSGKGTLAKKWRKPVAELLEVDEEDLVNELGWPQVEEQQV